MINQIVGVDKVTVSMGSGAGGGRGAAAPPPEFVGKFFNRVRAPPPDFGGFCSKIF